MNCTRCNVAHSSTIQLVSTEHGLLCPGCLEAIEALAIPTISGRVLLDADGHVVIDPAYNPYAELGPSTHFLKDAFKESFERVMRQLNDVQAARDFSQSMQQLQASAGQSSEQLSDLQDALLDMAKQEE